MFTSQRLVEHGRALRDAQMGSMPYAYPDSPESRKYEVGSPLRCLASPFPGSRVQCNMWRVQLSSPFCLHCRTNSSLVAKCLYG